MNTAMKWIDEVRGTDSIREVARRSGVNQATLNRQINLDMLSFDAVRDISRAFQRSLLSDLVKTGFLALGDVSEDSVESALHAATDEQLVLEVARRLGATDIGTIYDKPISEAVADASPTNVSRLEDAPDVTINTEGVKSTYGLAAKKGRRKADELPYAE